MGSSSHDLGAELRIHSFTVNCDTFSNEEFIAAVVPVTGPMFTSVRRSTVKGLSKDAFLLRERSSVRVQNYTGV